MTGFILSIMISLNYSPFYVEEDVELFSDQDVCYSYAHKLRLESNPPKGFRYTFDCREVTFL